MNDTPSFGPIHTIEPQTNHTHTVVLLHGRGSSGLEFAEEFLTSQTSATISLTEKFAGVKWIFPSSPMLWSTTFQESLPAWFEAVSLTDPTIREDLQIEGIRASVEHVRTILEQEERRLNGDVHKLLLGGISQGGAIGLWTALAYPHNVSAFFAASTWLPLASTINRVILDRDKARNNDESEAFVNKMIHINENTLRPLGLLGHGTDDAVVDISLGREASDLLLALGYDARWKEYSGASLEGHWFQEPNQMDDISRFIHAFVNEETIATD